MGGFVFQVIQLLKAGKAKEVSYNALASHIISEDGDNPEVGEAREVFDLPVVKVSSASNAVDFVFQPCARLESCVLKFLSGCPQDLCFKCEVTR